MTTRRHKTPFQVAAVIGAFFVAYGVYAMWFTKEPHPAYSAVSWALAAMWFALGWTSRKGTRP